jgi:hypothetical protein
MSTEIQVMVPLHVASRLPARLFTVRLFLVLLSQTVSADLVNRDTLQQDVTLGCWPSAHTSPSGATPSKAAPLRCLVASCSSTVLLHGNPSRLKW